MLKEHYLRSFELLRHKVRENDEYPFNLPVLKHLDKVELHPNVTFIIGDNGTGKSTLLEALAINYGFNPEGGSKNYSFSNNDTHSSLAKFLRISKGINKPKDGYFLRAESFYNASTYVEVLANETGINLYDYYGGKSLHEQSHGESFFSLFMHRFWGEGVYILDEPEAALSPQRLLSFLVRMHELVNQKSQFIIATHSPIVLSYPNSKIIEISEEGFKDVRYNESENYTIYKSFLDYPESMLEKLGIK